MTYISKKLTDAYRDRDRTFGNARFALSLVNEAKMNMGLRVMRAENKEDLTKEDLSSRSAWMMFRKSLKLLLVRKQEYLLMKNC